MNKLDIIFSSIGIFLLSILTLNHWYRGLYYEPLALLLLIVISPTVYHFMRLLYTSLFNIDLISCIFPFAKEVIIVS